LRLFQQFLELSLQIKQHFLRRQLGQFGLVTFKKDFIQVLRKVLLVGLVAGLSADFLEALKVEKSGRVIVRVNLLIDRGQKLCEFIVVRFIIRIILSDCSF
jgi:hypothetical protein